MTTTQARKVEDKPVDKHELLGRVLEVASARSREIVGKALAWAYASGDK